MKDGIEINVSDSEGVLSLFADVYDKMKVQNEMIFKLVEILQENRLITRGQSHTILELALDQISDPEEREKQKKELNDGTDDDGRMDSAEDEG